ncbi:hypothetical protein BH10BAC2_BH10BAC2_39870 [soil metagenome]
MNRKTKIFVSLAIAFFAATIFCMGSKYPKPIASEIIYGIAFLGTVFSIISKIVYNKEKRDAVKNDR